MSLRERLAEVECGKARIEGMARSSEVEAGLQKRVRELEDEKQKLEAAVGKSQNWHRWVQGSRKRRVSGFVYRHSGVRRRASKGCTRNSLHIEI